MIPPVMITWSPGTLETPHSWKGHIARSKPLHVYWKWPTCEVLSLTLKVETIAQISPGYLITQKRESCKSFNHLAASSSTWRSLSDVRLLLPGPGTQVTAQLNGSWKLIGLWINPPMTFWQAGLISCCTASCTCLMAGVTAVPLAQSRRNSCFSVSVSVKESNFMTSNWWSEVWYVHYMIRHQFNHRTWQTQMEMFSSGSKNCCTLLQWKLPQYSSMQI